MNKFHVGQKVRFLGNTHKIHYAIMPQIGEITRAGEITCSVRCKTRDSGDYKTSQDIYTCDLRPVGGKII